MATIVVNDLDALKDLVGRELPLSDWLTITQERVNQFAETTGDHQWIHLDPERARSESPYSTTIAHGFLTLSLLSYFVKQAIEVRGIRMGVNYGLNRVRFPAAVRVGSRIRAHTKLASLQEAEGAVDATLGVLIEVEGGDKPCCVAEWLVRYYR
jgi:acyl dehydratase